MVFGFERCVRYALIISTYACQSEDLVLWFPLSQDFQIVTGEYTNMYRVWSTTRDNWDIPSNENVPWNILRQRQSITSLGYLHESDSRWRKQRNSSEK